MAEYLLAPWGGIFEQTTASKPKTTKDRWLKRWVVQGVHGKYTVAKGADGKYGCSCPAWVYRRQTCKHIQHIIKSKGRNVRPAWTTTRNER